LKKEKLSNYFDWVKAIWLTSRGNLLDFTNRKYLVGIYQDQFQNIVFMKAGQMGLSERAISEAVWIADQLNAVTLYCFPAQLQLQDFVQARLNPVLNASEYLRARIDKTEDDKRVEKLGLKRIGKGYIYFRGSQNPKQIVSVDSDCIFLDERDRFDDENVPFIEKRLLASKLKWRRELSTPTIPGFGIHNSYLGSDQRVWEIPCKKCGTWQEIDFFKHIDFENKIVRCEQCGKAIDRFSEGRWTPQNPKSKIHGYKISGIYNPTVTVADLVAKYNNAQLSGFSALQQFFNQDLGLPYEVTGQSLVQSELDGCKRDYLAPLQEKTNCYAGCDVGNRLHVVVVQKLDELKMRVVWAGTVENFLGPYNSIESIMERYDIKTIVIDKKPEVKKVKELLERFPQKVYAADYPTINFPVNQYFIWDDIKYEVRLDRTTSLDYVVSDIQNQRIEFPGNIQSIPGFYDHLQASVRIQEKNKRTGTEVARWVEKGADHFFHALSFARMAQSRGIIGKALLDYYAKPDQGVTPNIMDWLRVKGERIF